MLQVHQQTIKWLPYSIRALPSFHPVWIPSWHWLQCWVWHAVFILCLPCYLCKSWLVGKSNILLSGLRGLGFEWQQHGINPLLSLMVCWKDMEAIQPVFPQNKLRDSRCSWNAIGKPSVWCGLSEFSNDWTSGRYDGCWCFRNAATKKLDDFPRFHWKPTKLWTGFKHLSYQQPWIAGFWLV